MAGRTLSIWREEIQNRNRLLDYVAGRCVDRQTLPLIALLKVSPTQIRHDDDGNNKRNKRYNTIVDRLRPKRSGQAYTGELNCKPGISYHCCRDC